MDKLSEGLGNYIQRQLRKSYLRKTLLDEPTNIAVAKELIEALEQDNEHLHKEIGRIHSCRSKCNEVLDQVWAYCGIGKAGRYDKIEDPIAFHQKMNEYMWRWWERREEL